MEEETYIEDLKDYKDLSYIDKEETYIQLFHKGVLVENMEVWTDRENERREYILVNSEIIYLDTIKNKT